MILQQFILPLHLALQKGLGRRPTQSSSQDELQGPAPNNCSPFLERRKKRSRQTTTTSLNHTSTESTKPNLSSVQSNAENSTPVRHLRKHGTHPRSIAAVRAHQRKRSRLPLKSRSANDNNAATTLAIATTAKANLSLSHTHATRQRQQPEKEQPFRVSTRSITAVRSAHRQANAAVERKLQHQSEAARLRAEFMEQMNVERKLYDLKQQQQCRVKNWMEKYKLRERCVVRIQAWCRSYMVRKFISKKPQSDDYNQKTLVMEDTVEQQNATHATISDLHDTSDGALEPSPKQLSQCGNEEANVYKKKLASAERENKSLRDLLKCPVCWDVKEDMLVAMTCGHRVCFDCYFCIGNKCAVCKATWKRETRVMKRLYNG